MTNQRPDTEPSRDGAGTASESVLRVLGDDTRRTIVERLASGPLPVGRLAEGLPVSRSAVSQHLKVLKEAHLVSDRAEGTRRVYQLDPAGLDLLRTYLDLLWARALEGFKQVVESDESTLTKEQP